MKGQQHETQIMEKPCKGPTADQQKENKCSQTKWLQVFYKYVEGVEGVEAKFSRGENASSYRREVAGFWYGTK